MMNLFYSSAVACLKTNGHNFSTPCFITAKTFFMKMLATAAARLVFFVLLFVAPLLAPAQEGGTKIDVDINENGSNWYNNPVVWIIGAAVFILLLVALLRGNNSSKS